MWRYLNSENLNWLINCCRSHNLNHKLLLLILTMTPSRRRHPNILLPSFFRSNFYVHRGNSLASLAPWTWWICLPLFPPFVFFAISSFAIIEKILFPESLFFRSDLYVHRGNSPFSLAPWIWWICLPLFPSSLISSLEVYR